MKVFVIRHPHDTYNPLEEKLEIFECETDDSINSICINKYNYFEGKWLKTPIKNPFDLNLETIFKTIVEGLRLLNYSYCFTTLKDAKIAKMILVRDVCSEYPSKIKKQYLDEIKQPLKEIKDKFPEYFI